MDFVALQVLDVLLGGREVAFGLGKDSLGACESGVLLGKGDLQVLLLLNNFRLLGVEPSKILLLLR